MEFDEREREKIKRKKIEIAAKNQKNRERSLSAPWVATLFARARRLHRGGATDCRTYTACPRRRLYSRAPAAGSRACARVEIVDPTISLRKSCLVTGATLQRGG